MQTATMQFIRKRSSRVFLLTIWAAVAGWTLSAESYWLHGLLCLLLIGFAWQLLEQLQRCRRELNNTISESEAARKELVKNEKMASLGHLVAGFAHEINTPIGVAVGAISNSEHTLAEIEQLLDSEEVSEQELRAALNTLKQGDELAISNLRRAAALIQSFKRTAIDQTSDQQRVFGLRELIDDVLRTLQNQLKRLPLKIAVNCPNDLKIEGVPGLLEQLLTNLLMNSIKHGFGQDKLTGTISISAQKKGQALLLDYRDDGAGMSPEVLDRLFEPFFTTRREDGGSGLGMTICYNIVTVNLGGTIDCQSNSGEGVKFLIEFPAQFVE